MTSMSVCHLYVENCAVFGDYIAHILTNYYMISYGLLAALKLLLHVMVHVGLLPHLNCIFSSSKLLVTIIFAINFGALFCMNLFIVL